MTICHTCVFLQLLLVWLPTLWAMTPLPPRQSADPLTTSSRSQCPTHRQTRTAKQVDDMFELVWGFFHPFLIFSCSSCGAVWFPCLFASRKPASRRGEACSKAPTCHSWDGRQVHHQHAKGHHASYTSNPGPAGQER